MKKTKMLVLALLGMMTRTVVGNACEKMVFAKDLPIVAKLFVQKNFPCQSIAFIEKNGSEYEISLNGGTELTFSEEGIWNKVDCKMEAIPTSLLPELAMACTKALFPGEKILSVVRTDNGYLTSLSNNLNLKFNQEGRLC